MAISKINRINSVTTPTVASNVTNVSKNLQNQLLIKQKNLKELSNDSKLSIEEKEKQRQELQKEIEELKRKLEQMQLKQEEAQRSEETKQKKELELEKTSETKTEKEENNTSAINKAEEHKRETIELSANEVQKMLDKNLLLKEEMIQQGAEYDQQNTVRVLSSEIRMDEIRGFDTSSKEEQLEEVQKKENFWMEAQNEANKQEVPPLINPDMKVILGQ